MNIATLNVALELISIFIIVKKVFENREFTAKTQSIITKVSKWTFGVYLVHQFIIDALQKYLHITAMSVDPIIGIPILTVFVYCVSMLISAILNSIPIVKKYAV